MSIVTRTERHVIHKNHELYNIIDNYAFKTKNLYNQANYRRRQAFFNNIIISYIDQYNEFKNEKPECYTDLQMVQPAQQILKILDNSWKSFFKANAEYNRHPEKFTGQPKIPKYKPKNGRFEIVFTNQNCKDKMFDSKYYIQFPRIFNKYLLPTKLEGSLQQVRIVPKNGYYVIEVVKELVINEMKNDNNRFMSIDIGIDNLAAIVTNTGMNPILVNGKGLKSINQYSNKQAAYFKSLAKKLNHKETSNRIQKLWMKRSFKIEDFLHKASKHIVELADHEDISCIIIGKNKGWKQKSNLGKKTNQNFVQIPSARFIEMITYKAEEVGIKVITTEESYTSGTSFLDNESPVKDSYDKSRRIKRGLFKSNTGKLINADINGAFQIMKKVAPNVYINGVEGVVIHPIKVNII